jgi:polysaccharide export outer membrane protein
MKMRTGGLLLSCFVIFCLVCPYGFSDVEMALGEGDVLSINILGYPQYSKAEATIGPDGKINMPLIGDIKATGLTPSQLSYLIAEKFQTGKFLKEPHVFVTLVKSRSRFVSVIGQGVNEPGIYPLEGETRIMEVVARAKPNDRAMLRQVSLTRGDQQQIVNLEKLLNQADLKQNILLQPGDVINVPEDRESFAFIMGEVNKPGAISIKSSVTLAEAIALAGGQTQDALMSRITVSHSGEELREIDLTRFLLEGDLSQNIVLRPGDIVNIPLDTEDFVNVLGQVKNPGKIRLPLRGMNLLQALAQAGGVTDIAWLSHIRIISLDRPARMINLDQAIDTGDMSEVPMLSAGDTVLVPEKSMVWRKFTRLVAEIILLNTAISIIRDID